MVSGHPEGRAGERDGLAEDRTGGLPEGRSRGGAAEHGSSRPTTHADGGGTTMLTAGAERTSAKATRPCGQHEECGSSVRQLRATAPCDCGEGDDAISRPTRHDCTPTRRSDHPIERESKKNPRAPTIQSRRR